MIIIKEIFLAISVIMMFLGSFFFVNIIVSANLSMLVFLAGIIMSVTFASKLLLPLLNKLDIVRCVLVALGYFAVFMGSPIKFLEDSLMIGISLIVTSILGFPILDDV